ncbi:MAG: cytochrome c3 family protein [Pseudomonadota bacterium]
MLATLALCHPAQAARISDITNTKHNLSAGSTTTSFKAAGESGICVFCHTPHGAATAEGAPLWNRTIPASGTYAIYGSGSMQAGTITDIANPSKLCLTCHDGTQALGAVNNAPGSGTGSGITMAGGVDKLTGNAMLGTDLTNDHPISITFDSALAASDGELFDPATAAHIGDPTPGHDRSVLTVPLNNGKVECASCHDPHIRDSSGEDIKFLRLNRFQSTVAPSDGAFNTSNDIICIACHDKNGWVGSSHASSAIATETYTDAAADARGFPRGLPVYRAACLNCHDPHTVQGAQRLQRQAGTENTCYQCHGNSSTTVLTDVSQVPNMQKDFSLAYRMPISNSDQGLGASDPEHHNVRNADLTESNAGVNNTLSGPNNDSSMRHAECTDCHNPHRVANNTQADLGGLNTSATHNHAAGHTNEASGVLRGSWGVEPIYGGSMAFDTVLDQASGYTVKKGLGADAVSKEYQVCLKCHSSYAFGTTPPLFGNTIGGSGENNGILSGVTTYTDQAKEFAPVNSVGNTGASAMYTNQANNHRSWHPVIGATGRNKTTRTMTHATVNSFLAPWNGTTDVGTQTMYCSDCHGVATANGTSTPGAGDNWGPHGSTKPFILKGDWTPSTGQNQQDDLCFKCHNYDVYATTTYRNSPTTTGFSGGGDNLHALHVDKMGNMRCMWCHVAVPHGWKNKALLVNLNDIGPEALQPSGVPYPIGSRITLVRGSNGLPATNDGRAPLVAPPYYYGASLAIYSFATSGNWQASNCEGGGISMDDACGQLP